MAYEILSKSTRYPDSSAFRGKIPTHSLLVEVEADAFDVGLPNRTVKIGDREFTVSHVYPRYGGGKGEPNCGLLLCAGWENEFPRDEVLVGDDIVFGDSVAAAKVESPPAAPLGEPDLGEPDLGL